MRNNQQGFGGVEFVLSIIIVSLIGSVGVYVYNAKNSPQTTASNQQTTAKSDASKTTEVAPQIKSTSDLDKAVFALDQASTDIDMREADSLEKDINNL